MRTFISSLALGILLAPQAFAGDTGTVAIGSGVGGALANEMAGDSGHRSRDRDRDYGYEHGHGKKHKKHWKHKHKHH